MTLFLFQVPPLRLDTAQISFGGPPAISILFNLPPAKNPIRRLSGDQNGYEAPSVRSSNRGSTDPVSRTNNEGAAEAEADAMYAIKRPFGEIAML